MEYENLFSKQLKVVFRTMRTEEADVNFVLQKHNFSSETEELPLGLIEISDILNTLDESLKAIVSIDFITLKPKS